MTVLFIAMVGEYLSGPFLSSFLRVVTNAVDHSYIHSRSRGIEPRHLL